MANGTVESIHVAAAKAAPVEPADRIRVTGEGVEGDRKFGQGNVTLVEAEAIEGLAADTGIQLAPGESRRQVTTRGIGLNELVGRRFRVGTVEAVGVEQCHPCRHLEKLTAPGVLKGLVDRGGLRADVVRGGEIAVGDAVEDLGPAG